MAEEKKTTPEVTPNKKAEYARRRSESAKAKIQERKKEKSEGRLDERRLAFLANIINAFGMTRVELAKRIQTTPQNLYYIFSVADDCTLSKAEKILEALGLTLKVEIKNDELEKKNRKRKPIQNEYTSAGTVNKIIGNIPGFMENGFQMPSALSDTIKNYPKGERLTFLAEYLVEVNQSMRSIERELSRSYGTIAKKFAHGHNDIDISMIYEIANATGGEIHWIVNPIKE